MPEPLDLLIVGAGGFAREAAATVAAINQAGPPRFRLLGYLDDKPSLHGTTIGGNGVLGPVDAVADHPDAAVVVCTGSPTSYWSRRTLVERLDLPADRYATLVHPLASIGSGCSLREGCVVLATAVATTAVEVGAHVAVMPAVTLTHDNVVGSFATFGAGARLAGGVTVADGAYVGSGGLVREGLRVGAWSLVGMGAVVLSDIPAYETWAGIPARRLGPSPAAG